MDEYSQVSQQGPMPAEITQALTVQFEQCQQCAGQHVITTRFWRDIIGLGVKRSLKPLLQIGKVAMQLMRFIVSLPSRLIAWRHQH